MSVVPSAEAVPNHAGLMDQVYQYQRYIYDFTRKYYLFGRDRLIRELGLKGDERLLEIGCGTARNLIAIARAYPQARLDGLDASAEMLKTARTAIRRAGLEDRIQLTHGLAEDLSPALFGVGGFENVLFSYSLSMIPDWRGALRAGAAVLSAQGRIHIVDFGDFRTFPAKKLVRGWLSLFHVTPRDVLLESLEAGLSKQGENRLTILPGRYAFILSGKAVMAER